MKSPAEQLAKLFRLPPHEQALLVRAWLWLLLVDLALRLLPFTVVLRHSCRPSTAPPPRRTPSPARMAWLVEAAGRCSPLGTSCLKEALVLSRLLAGRGVASTLTIGVARPRETFTAHAWLEHEGQVILGGSHRDNYIALPPLIR